MYYVFRVSENWTIYDSATKKGKPLTADEKELMQKMFGRLLNDNGMLMSGVKVETIPPGKLGQLPMGEK